MMWLFLQAVVAGKQVAPQTWGAWAGLIFGGGSFLILIFDRIVGRGKSLQGLDSKIERLCEEVNDFKETQTVMDGHLSTLSASVRSLTQEWKGDDGTNGYKSLVRQLLLDVKQIMDRNTRIDAIADYERQQMRKSGRTPERARDHLEGNEP